MAYAGSKLSNAPCSLLLNNCFLGAHCGAGLFWCWDPTVNQTAKVLPSSEWTGSNQCTSGDRADLSKHADLVSQGLQCRCRTTFHLAHPPTNLPLPPSMTVTLTVLVPREGTQRGARAAEAENSGADAQHPHGPTGGL